jgi:ketosteroid isomerase-like protein
LARRDLDAVQAVFDPEVVIEQQPPLPWAGRYTGSPDARGNQSLPAREIHVWRLHAGKVTHFQVYVDAPACSPGWPALTHQE